MDNPKTAERPKPPVDDHGTPYKDMSTSRKVRFVLKIVVCVLTFGMAFPNVMND